MIGLSNIKQSRNLQTCSDHYEKFLIKQYANWKTIERFKKITLFAVLSEISFVFISTISFVAASELEFNKTSEKTFNQPNGPHSDQLNSSFNM